MVSPIYSLYDTRKQYLHIVYSYAYTMVIDKSYDMTFSFCHVICVPMSHKSCCMDLSSCCMECLNKL